MKIEVKEEVTIENLSAMVFRLRSMSDAIMNPKRKELFNAMIQAINETGASILDPIEIDMPMGELLTEVYGLRSRDQSIVIEFWESFKTYEAEIKEAKYSYFMDQTVKDLAGMKDDGLDASDFYVISVERFRRIRLQGDYKSRLVSDLQKTFNQNFKVDSSGYLEMKVLVEKMWYAVEINITLTS